MNGARDCRYFSRQQLLYVVVVVVAADKRILKMIRMRTCGKNLIIVARSAP